MRALLRPTFTLSSAPGSCISHAQRTALSSSGRPFFLRATVRASFRAGRRQMSHDGFNVLCTATPLANGNGAATNGASHDAAEVPSSMSLDELIAQKRKPSEAVLTGWKTAQAVCFDVDCTLCKDDGLDALAAYCGIAHEKVSAITDAAMNGAMTLEEALDRRLALLDPTPFKLQGYLHASKPLDRLNPGAMELVAALHARGVDVYLISGGFRELVLPIAKLLGISGDRVFANRFFFGVDEITGMATKYAGYDTSQPTAHGGGKSETIKRLRVRHPYKTIVMVGDGMTDREAAEVEGGADLFVGYGGVVTRPAVAAAADWFVLNFKELSDALKTYKVAFIGSGAWACAAAMIVAANCARLAEFDTEVRMWVYEETLDGGAKLTTTINETHVNPKYLPGVALGDNVVAEPELARAVEGANVLIFCVPHQFIHRIVVSLQGKVRTDAVAISLTKGMRVRTDGPQLVSEMIHAKLGVDCSVLMGANIAEEIGRGQLSEATVGYRWPKAGELFRRLFETDTFIVNKVQDVEGVEVCGTLKNVVAVGAGFVDGLGLGANTKAAVLRAGLAEMKRLARALFPTVRDETFLESCGVGDLVATCYGGRNRRVAEEFARSGGSRSFADLEAEMLAGQKLQGPITSDEVQAILDMNGWAADYPLFTAVYLIVHGILPPKAIARYGAAVREHLEALAATTHQLDGEDMYGGRSRGGVVARR